MNRKKSILFFIGSPAIFCFSLSRQALSNKHTVAVRRKSNRRKYDRPKHSTPTRRSGNTCRSIIPEPHPTVVRIRHTPGRNDMIRAGNNICRPFRHGNTVFVTAKRPASHRKTEPQNRGGGGPAAPGLCFPYGVPVRSGYGTVYRNTSPEIPRRRNHPPSRRHHSNRCRPILSLNARGRVKTEMTALSKVTDCSYEIGKSRIIARNRA